jgi:hypothetical protein
MEIKYKYEAFPPGSGFLSLALSELSFPIQVSSCGINKCRLTILLCQIEGNLRVGAIELLCLRV